MAVDSNRIQAIFQLALEAADASVRAQILERECGADLELRQRVESLLAAHEASGGFLDQSLNASLSTVDESPVPEQPGNHIGSYKLLQQIGEGGMGVVFLAEQLEPVQRKVALKVIKPGMDTRQVVARFEAERQALALMDHPNIAKVLDAGTTDSGRPYFVMELVKGLPISRYCDEHRLPPAERLALFVPVCYAVQHAHQKGIIHRDLKPTNILVASYDGRPVPKVIDFGVAKALGQKLTHQTLFTGFGSIVGTFEYMSPEQAEFNALDVDTRSDIYSLGVLLYELLTGSTPLNRKRLAKRAIEEILRAIREDEPPRPSLRLSESRDSLASISAQRRSEPAQLTRLLRGELDWIVMKALDKDRGRRYETANGLAGDVQRYLADEPVEACPASAAYRLWKFARKHRVLLSTAAAFVALLLLAAGVSTWLAVHAMQAESAADTLRVVAQKAESQTAAERDHAQREWQRAEDAGQLAKASAVRAEQALDRLTVGRGIQLAEEGDLFTGLLWLAQPLERGGLSPEDDRLLRTRFACYLRHTRNRPVLRHLLFHDAWLSELTFSADARRLLTVCGEVIRIWDLHGGECIAALPAHPGANTAKFSPDGTRVLTIDGRGVRTWDINTSRMIDFSLLNPEDVAEAVPAAMPQSPWEALTLVVVQQLLRTEADGSLAVIGPDCGKALIARGSRVQLYDLSTRKLLQAWNKPSGFFDARFSPDGGRIILLSGAALEIHEAHPGPGADVPVVLRGVGYFLGFSQDGRRIATLATAEGTGKVMVWDAASGKAIGPAPDLVPETGVHGNVAELSPDGGILGQPMGDFFGPGTLCLWDADRSRKLAERRVTGKALLGVFFGPDGQHVATMDDRTVRLWGVPSLEQSGPGLTGSAPFQLSDEYVFRAGFRFSPDARLCATAARDGTVQIWDFAGAKPSQAALKSRPNDLTRKVDYRLRKFSILNAGTITLTDSPSTTSDLYLEKLPRAVREQDPSLAVSPDETRLLTIVPADPAKPRRMSPGTFQLWDNASGTAVNGPIEHDQAILYAEFSPDSRLLVTVCDDGSARLWNARTGLPVGQPLQHTGIHHAAFNQDGSLLVTSGGNQAQVWRTNSQQRLGKAMVHAAFVNRAAFSPDGKSVATASSDYSARLWDPLTGDPLGPPLAHPGLVVHVAFSPDSRTLVTQNMLGNGNSSEARLWDVRTHQQISPSIRGADTAPGNFLFTADSRSLIDWDSGLQFDVSPAEGPANELIKLAQLYASQRLESGGGLVPLTNEEYRALWKELRATRPQEFTVRHESALDWRDEQLQTAASGSNRAAVALHRRCLARELAAAAWRPGLPPDSFDRPQPLLERFMALAIHGRDGEATAAGEVLASRRPHDGETLYGCACVHALAAGAAKSDSALSERYAARAVILLRQAAHAGFGTGDQIRTDPDLLPLRERDDFRKLLAELAKKSG